MLCLTRKVGERIMISDDIVITVVEVRHGRVSLGIAAPERIKVWRSELVALPKTDRVADTNGGAV